MNLKVISCNVFKREIEYAAKLSPHKLDIEFLELGEHARPARLRERLQARIDSASAFDAVLLGYGLCGRASDGLTARKVPLVLPRAHDCCTLLLGSRKRFEELFRSMPSAPFSSVGYIEHGEYFFSDGEAIPGDGWEALVEQYGEDDARFIYDAMHPKLDGAFMPVSFISMPEIPSVDASEICRKKAEEEGRPFRMLDGNMRLIRNLLDGNWNEDEFQVVLPGESIRQMGDWDKIIRASE